MVKAVMRGAAIATVAGVLQTSEAATIVDSNDAAGNPVRKVLALLMRMNEKIEAQAREEQKTYDKYTCWCSKTKKQLNDEIAHLTNPNIIKQADIDKLEGEKVKTETEAAGLKKDQADAKRALDAATAQRAKDKEAFTAASSDEKATFTSAKKATEILMTKQKSFLLQTKLDKIDGIKFLQQAVMSSSAPSDQKLKLTALLSGKDATVSPDMVTGILSEIGDAAERKYNDLVKAEAEAVDYFMKLRAAKGAEIESLMESVSRKNNQATDIQVKIVDSKHELDSTVKALASSRQMLAETEEQCAEKAKAWDERTTTRNQENLAVQETIKFLNSDAAHETMEKTQERAQTALMLQTSQAVNADDIKKEALKAVAEAKQQSKDPAQLNFLALALTSKKVDFTKVKEMINDMIRLMRTQSRDDENKRNYCRNAFKDTAREQSKIGHEIKDLDVSIADKKGDIALLIEENNAMQLGLDALLASRDQAFETRKEENKEYEELLAENNAAIKLLEVAKNRLFKFYNPDAYVAKSEYSFLQIDQVPKAPKAFDETYVKNGDSTPVIGMLSTIESDLKSELKAAESVEKRSKTLFDEATEVAAQKSRDVQLAIEAKQRAKADLEAEAIEEQGRKTAKDTELKAEQDLHQNLHTECDWLLANLEAREAARTKESEALKRASASLMGAK
eukprot:TRINITY_DN111368_c0_g1_i1.p1 TRINITY_DN111368_c0_g1~~TRINITY_DN111368_c0_g1_i1.p1  ORF type:complete len:678 (-),score=227.07 TRINITY_DN111368_c0_g1_i1:165-2198(-)